MPHATTISTNKIILQLSNPSSSCLTDCSYINNVSGDGISATGGTGDYFSTGDQSVEACCNSCFSIIAPYYTHSCELFDNHSQATNRCNIGLATAYTSPDMCSTPNQYSLDFYPNPNETSNSDVFFRNGYCGQYRNNKGS